MTKEELEARAKEYASKEVYYGAYVDEEAGMGIVEEVYVEAAERETKLLQVHLSEQEEKLSKAREIIMNLLPFESVIDPYAFTSSIEENKKRFHEPFRKAREFLKEFSNDAIKATDERTENES